MQSSHHVNNYGVRLGSRQVAYPGCLLGLKFSIQWVVFERYPQQTCPHRPRRFPTST